MKTYKFRVALLAFVVGVIFRTKLTAFLIALAVIALLISAMTSCSAGGAANESPADTSPGVSVSPPGVALNEDPADEPRVVLTPPPGGASAAESPAENGAASKSGAKDTPPLQRNDAGVADIKGMKTNDAVWGEYITSGDMEVCWVYFESPADLAGLPYDPEYTSNFVVLRVKSTGDVFETDEFNGASQIAGISQQNSVCEILAGVGFRDKALSGEIEVAQNKAKGEGNANLMQEGHVYVISIGDIGNIGKKPSLMSDINGLLEVDEKGLIHSHSKEKKWKAYDGATIEKLWGDIVSWYENEKLFAAKNFIGGNSVVATGKVKNIRVKEEKDGSDGITTSYIIFSMENVQALSGETAPEFDMAYTYYPDDGAAPDIDVKAGDSFLFGAVPDKDLEEKGYGKYSFYPEYESAWLGAEGRFEGPIARSPDGEGPQSLFASAKGKTLDEFKAYMEKASDFLSAY